MKKITFNLFLISVLILNTAVVIRHDTPDVEYRNLASNYPAVGSLTSPMEDLFCSCTLVAPNMVVTAAHCIDVNSDGQADTNEWMSTQVIFGSDGNNPSHSVAVDTFFLNPQWHQAGALNGLNGNDIALIRLASPITDIPIMQISVADPVGLIGTTVGYGATANGNTTSTGEPDGLKRAGQNLIEYKTTVGTGDLDIGGLHGDFDSPDGSTNTMDQFFMDLGLSQTSPSTPLDLEGFGWGGDSGGPVSANFSDGEGNVVVGIASASFNPINDDAPCGYGAIDIWASFSNPEVPEFLESHGLTLHTGDVSSLVEVTDHVDFQLNTLPNPFISTCNFDLDLKGASTVSLIIYNIKGEVVETLIDNESFTRGRHIYEWTPKTLDASFYFYRLQANEEIVAGKIMHLK